MVEKKGNGIIRFYHKHPVLMNIIFIIITGLLLTWILVGPFLGRLTRHGDTATVPGVKGMPIHSAINMLIDGEFEVQIDSIYDKNSRPGSVTEQSPIQGATVKDGRTIYLTYACFNPKLVKVPMYYNMSRRQATAAFEEIGLTNITVKEVPSEHADLVLSARYNGLILQPGKEIPIGASIVIEVGAGFGDEYYEEEITVGDSIHALTPEEADAEYIRELEEELNPAAFDL